LKPYAFFTCFHGIQQDMLDIVVAKSAENLGIFEYAHLRFTSFMPDFKSRVETFSKEGEQQKEIAMRVASKLEAFDGELN